MQTAKRTVLADGEKVIRNAELSACRTENPSVARIKKMEFKNLLPAKNRDELRQWLSENYNKENECWVVM